MPLINYNYAVQQSSTPSLQEATVVTSINITFSSDDLFGAAVMNQLSQQSAPVANMPSTSTTENEKKVKRFRTAFTTEQLIYLEAAFKKEMYMSRAQRAEIAEQLALDEKHIRIWFQNRRAKQKKEEGELRRQASGSFELMPENCVLFRQDTSLHSGIEANYFQEDFGEDLPSLSEILELSPTDLLNNIDPIAILDDIMSKESQQWSTYGPSASKNSSTSLVWGNPVNEIHMDPTKTCLFSNN